MEAQAKPFVMTKGHKLINEVINAWCEEVGTPFALMLSMMYNEAMKGSREAVIDITSLDYLHRPYLDSETEIMSKEYPLWYFLKTYPCYPGYDIEDRKAAAISKFLQTEERCKDTDNRLSRMIRDKRRPGFHALIAHIQKYVAKAMGKFDQSKLTMRHGDGAVVGARGVYVHPAYRFSSFVVNPRFEENFRALADHSNRWQLAKRPTYRCASEGQLVPKDAFEERYIAPEVLCNMQGQLALGDYITDRLRRLGIHIKDVAKRDPILEQCGFYTKPVLAPELNGIMAMLGSEFGTYATIDQSSSGDHWTMYFLWLAFRKTDAGWWEYLVSTRSKYHYVPGHGIIRLRKAATAGNGWLFPVQCLLYAAVTSFFVKNREDWNVFGDDVVVVNHKALQVMHALTLLGHKVNTKKSFFNGFVRESCGYDWANGYRLHKSKAKTHYERNFDDYCLELHNALYDVFTSGGAKPLSVGARVLNTIRRFQKKHGSVRFNAVPYRNSAEGYIGESRHWETITKHGITYAYGHRYQSLQTNDDLCVLDETGDLVRVEYRKAFEKRGGLRYTVVTTLEGEALLQFALAKGVNPTFRGTRFRRRRCKSSII